MMPGHPTFGFRASAGINVGNAGFEEFIAVNQVGKRFFNEVRLPARPGLNRYPGDGGAPGQGLAAHGRSTGAIARRSGSGRCTTMTTASMRHWR